MKVAVLDLYNQTPNLGMKGIHKLLGEFRSKTEKESIQYDLYDVRSRNELPDLNYDAYISSGGPGDPNFVEAENNPEWGQNWVKWISSIQRHNEKTATDKKMVFLICHSFQMMCIYTGVAQVQLRNSPSFGIFPMHKTLDGESEILFENLSDPFYAVDSRKYQVLDPDRLKMEAMNMKILAYEKIRPHVSYDRAIMAIRFTPEIIGTQFHPEADPQNMLSLFQTPEKRNEVIREHREEKYNDMILSLQDPQRITKTYKTLIPNFLEMASQMSNKNSLI